MKIYVNMRSISNKTTGVQRYGSEILSRLDNIYKVGEDKGAGILGHAWEQMGLPYLISDGVLWSPANTGPISVSRQVVTIHDLAALDHPEWFNKKFSYWYNFVLPRVAKKSQKIITVSEFSKSRIVERFQIDHEKIHVIPLGVDKNFSNTNKTIRDEEILRKFSINEGKYFLFVSSLEPRKNMSRIIKAWDGWQDKPSDVRLVFVGDTTEIFDSVNIDKNRESIIFTGRINDSDLYVLYRNAIAFLYVSLYEGFGLPVLEAMASGTPVIASNTSSVPEAAGDAAIMVDPMSEEEILNSMREILHNESLRGEMVFKGLRHAKKFSWETTAEETYKVLDSVRST